MTNNEPDYDNLYFEEKKMIKVGQVYKVFNVNQVITHIEKTYGRYWWVSMINKNGSPSGMFCKKNMSCHQLIAEYTTWQEAVNSKEFNDA